MLASGLALSVHVSSDIYVRLAVWSIATALTHRMLPHDDEIRNCLRKAWSGLAATVGQGGAV